MVGRDTPEPNARGDHVRPRMVQAAVSEPRIPRIYPWGASTRKAQELVKEWLSQNQKELLEMWESQNLRKLPPL